MGAGEILHVDPASLHLPGSRNDGADPWKLQRQIARYGKSTAGMPPIGVSRGSDGELVIIDGVTRASRIAKLLPGQEVVVEVVAKLRAPVGDFPTVGDTL
jgi:hypothetical protein